MERGSQFSIPAADVDNETALDTGRLKDLPCLLGGCGGFGPRTVGGNRRYQRYRDCPRAHVSSVHV